VSTGAQKGQLAGAIVGGAIGWFVGMPMLGASLGSMVGGIAGGLIDPATTDTTGAHLGDQQITTSAYGTAIALGYGTFRVGGNVIWASAPLETKNIASSGKGMGGSSTATTFTYSRSFAIAFAAGPASDVLRIWFDSKLVMDKKSPSSTTVVTDSHGHTQTYVTTNNPDGTTTRTVTEGTTTDTKEGVITTTLGPTLTDAVSYQFYGGTEDQLPDPTIEADIGVGKVPGHRGLVYIVFNTLQLANYGNRIPQVTAEIAFGTAKGYPWFQTTTFDSTARNTSYATSFGSSAYDPYSSTLYRVGMQGIDVFDMSTGQQTNFRSWTDGAAGDEINDASIAGIPGFHFTPNANGFGSEPYLGPDGYLYIFFMFGNAGVLTKVDPGTLMQVDAGGHFSSALQDSSGIGAGAGTIVAACTIGSLQYLTTTGTKTFAIVISFASQICAVDTDDMHVDWTDRENDQVYDSSLYPGSRIFQDEVGAGQGSAWIASSFTGATLNTTHTYDFYRLTASPTLTGGLLGSVASWSLTKTLGLTAAQLVAHFPAAQAAGMIAYWNGMAEAWFDPSDQSIIFCGKLTSTTSTLSGPQMSFIAKYRDPTGLIWVTQLPNGTLPINKMYAFIQHNRLAWSIIGATMSIDTSNGTIVRYDPSSAWANGPESDAIYDGYVDAIITGRSDNKGGSFNRVITKYLNRASAGEVQLSDIIENLVEKVDLTPQDVNLSELDDLVKGYYIARPTTIKEALTTLQVAYFFDLIESDYILKAVKRGRSPIRTITQDEFGENGGSTNKNSTSATKIFAETRTQEFEMPREVQVSFMDADREYQDGNQSRRRRFQPKKAMHSQNVTSLSLPLVLTADEARQFADKAVYSTWIERTNYKGFLSWSHLDLDPTDVITVLDSDGTVYQPRLTKMTLGANYTLEIEALSNDPAAYTSTIQAGTLPVPHLSRVPSSNQTTRLFLMGLPLLRDLDDTGGTTSRVYFGMAGAGSAAWTGATIFRSTDNANYDALTGQTTGVAWGSALTALPDNDDPWTWDDVTQLKAAFNQTTAPVPPSTTDEQVLGGANAFAIINSDKEWEIIQAVNITQNEDGTFTLSRLLRGRRGTDVFAFNHGVGDQIVYLDPTAIGSFDQRVRHLHRGANRHRLRREHPDPTDLETIPDERDRGQRFVQRDHAGSHLACRAPTWA
jgi:hypothetical protein